MVDYFQQNDHKQLLRSNGTNQRYPMINERFETIFNWTWILLKLETQENKPVVLISSFINKLKIEPRKTRQNQETYWVERTIK